jgi:hypothetical protein
MTTEVPMSAVTVTLARLYEAAVLVRTSVEDHPDDPEHRPDHKALTDLGDAVDDFVDAVDEAGWAARTGHGNPPATLPAVHRALLRASAALHGDLLRLDRRFDAARREARTWGGPWRPWSDVVLTNLLDAADALGETERAVAASWAATLAPPRHPAHRPAHDQEGSP